MSNMTNNTALELSQTIRRAIGSGDGRDLDAALNLADQLGHYEIVNLLNRARREDNFRYLGDALEALGAA